MNLRFILKQPIITEKSLKEAALGRFGFIVANNSTKGQIRQAVQAYYHVDVVGIRTTKVAAKSYRVGKRRQQKFRQPTKKAIVQLKPGQKIDLFDVSKDHSGK